MEAPSIKAKPGEATEDMDRRHQLLLGRIGSVRLRIGRLGRSEERPTSSNGWIKAEEKEDEEEEVSVHFKGPGK